MDKFKIEITDTKTLIKVTYPDVMVVSVDAYEEPHTTKKISRLHMLTVDDTHYMHNLTNDDDVKIIRY